MLLHLPFKLCQLKGKRHKHRVLDWPELRAKIIRILSQARKAKKNKPKIKTLNSNGLGRSSFPTPRHCVTLTLWARRFFFICFWFWTLNKKIYHHLRQEEKWEKSICAASLAIILYTLLQAFQQKYVPNSNVTSKCNGVTRYYFCLAVRAITFSSEFCSRHDS
jgi:hypothetical protein